VGLYYAQGGDSRGVQGGELFIFGCIFGCIFGYF